MQVRSQADARRPLLAILLCTGISCSAVLVTDVDDERVPIDFSWIGDIRATILLSDEIRAAISRTPALELVSPGTAGALSVSIPERVREGLLLFAYRVDVRGVDGITIGQIRGHCWRFALRSCSERIVTRIVGMVRKTERE